LCANKIIGGVDDAGRGCIIGPLVLSGISIAESHINDLVDCGVRDSKTISPNNREKLYSRIKQIATKVISKHLAPEEIDKYVARKQKYTKLNYLEAITAGQIINLLAVDLVYVDASDTVTERFKQNIQNVVKYPVEIVSEHHADQHRPTVSAASIIAKVERDREINKLQKKYGDFGSGYPSDQKTIDFLKKWLEKNNSKPSFTRKTWKTWDRISNLNINQFNSK